MNHKTIVSCGLVSVALTSFSVFTLMAQSPDESAFSAESGQSKSSASKPVVDPTGTWTWEQQFGGRTTERSVTLSFVDGALSGTYGSSSSGRSRRGPGGFGGRSGFNAPVEISNGKLAGDKLSFEVTRRFGPNEFTTVFAGVIVDDEIAGMTSVEFGGRTRNSPWLAVRAAGPQSSGPVDASNGDANGRVGPRRDSEQVIPRVYSVEHTGKDFAQPTLPAFDELPSVRPLPDPFAWSSGRGRSTRFADWSRRRAEIASEIEHYGIGAKPPRPSNIQASYSDQVLTVVVTENGESITLTSRIELPEGDGPFPAVIGIGRGSGSLPSDIFTSRSIAQIAFNFAQVMSHTQTRGEEPINRLYPELTHIGAYSAWSWGVSRLIDGLELVADELPINRERIAITGCSFAGKMALFAGAYDERIALTISKNPVAEEPRRGVFRRHLGMSRRSEIRAAHGLPKRCFGFPIACPSYLTTTTN